MGNGLRRRTASEHSDRLGVAAVAYAFETLGWIFRELPTSDYGVDAIVEVVTDEIISGELFGVQIKSGDTHLRRQKHGTFLYADKEHVEYWLQHTLPIVIVVSEPHSGQIFWQAVKPEFLVQTPEQYKLQFFDRMLDKSNARQLVESLFNQASRHHASAFGQTAPQGLDTLRAPSPKDFQNSPLREYYERAAEFTSNQSSDEPFHIFLMDWHLRSLFIESIEALEAAFRDVFSHAKLYACDQFSEDAESTALFDVVIPAKDNPKKSKTNQYISDVCFEKFVYRRHPIGAGRMTRGRQIPYDTLRDEYNRLSDESLLNLFTMRIFRSFHQIAKSEFRVGVGTRLKLPTSVTQSVLAGLSAVKAAGRREEPVWNWRAGHYRPMIKFPNHLRSPSGLGSGNPDDIYSYCVVVRYLLIRLDRDHTQFDRKLASILGLVDKGIHRKMGFPKDWGNQPFWA